MTPGPPPRRRTRRQAGLVLTACILASSLVGMDSLMTTVALPAVAGDLDAGLAVQQWIVAAFLLAVGSLILVGGALGDVYGRRPVFAAGTAGFGAAALVCAVAPTSGVLVTGRLLQGAAAALLLPSVLAVITAAFDEADRSRAIARWSAWSGLSVIAGPVVGGLLIDALSWRAVYWAELPCAAVVVALILRATPPGDGTAGASVDLAGAALAVPAVGGPAFYLIQSPRSGWGDPLTLTALVAGIASLAAFLAWERRARTPLLPPALFRIRAFAAINATTFVLYGALIACGTYTILFLQENLGYGPAPAGIAGAVPIMVLFVLSGRFGALADRHGGRPFIAGGSLLAGLGMLLLLRADAGTSLWTVVLPSVLVHGLGLAMLVAPLTSGVMSAAPADRAGVASGINNAIARIGSMMAIAVLGVVISVRFSAELDDGLARAGIAAPDAAVLDAARERPLSDEPPAALPYAERAALEPVLADASASAFRTGAGAAGALAVLAGAIAWAGYRDPKAAAYDAAGTLGCPITGARDHVEAPPIGSRAAQPAG